MINLYHYLYFQVYLANVKVWGQHKDQNFRTITSLTFCLLVNFLTIVIILDYFDFHAFEKVPDLSKDLKVFIVMIFGVIQYVYFKFNNRYQKILLDFNINRELQKAKYYYVGRIYCFGSCALLVLAGIAYNLIKFPWVPRDKT